jgi:hypothetical protein
MYTEYTVNFFRRLKLPCTIPDVLTLHCTLYPFLKDKYSYSEHLGTLSRYNNSICEKGIDKTITHNLLSFRSSIIDSLSIINTLWIILPQIISICTSQFRLIPIITSRKLVLLLYLPISLFFIRILIYFPAYVLLAGLINKLF